MFPVGRRFCDKMWVKSKDNGDSSTVTITNVERMGKSEVEIVSKVIRAVLKLIEMEMNVQAGEEEDIAKVEAQLNSDIPHPIADIKVDAMSGTITEFDGPPVEEEEQ